MRGVTGGGAPAGIWHDFMAGALPKLKAQPIPGGVVDVAPAEGPDPIGDVLSGADPGQSAPVTETPAPKDEVPY
jgi:penicillin-binding protein 1A